MHSSILPKPRGITRQPQEGEETVKTAAYEGKKLQESFAEAKQKAKIG